jgi:hypothetical protein
MQECDSDNDNDNDSDNDDDNDDDNDNDSNNDSNNDYIISKSYCKEVLIKSTSLLIC